MIHAEGVVGGHRGRYRRSIAEKRRIVELTFEPGASVAQIALANGVNANQVFSLRRAFKLSSGASWLSPVVIPGLCSPW